MRHGSFESEKKMFGKSCYEHPWFMVSNLNTSKLFKVIKLLNVYVYKILLDIKYKDVSIFGGKSNPIQLTIYLHSTISFLQEQSL